MPYFRGDPEMFDEIMAEVDADDLPPDFASKRPTGDYEFQPAEARFDPRKFDDVSRQAFDALIANGATGMRVNYDGGHDEGFSHPLAVMFGPQERPIEHVAKQLAAAPFVAGMRAAAAAATQRYNPGARPREISDEELATGGIEALADALASTLLGEGYGTGEYTMYGAFTADFATGRIIDDPKAAKPRNIDLE